MNMKSKIALVTGASSGAMMTNVLLADYPDVFKAGAAFVAAAEAADAALPALQTGRATSNGVDVRI